MTVQTPQGFSARPLLEAFRAAAAAGVEATDTAATMEKFSDLVVRTVPGDPDNIKVTWPEDLVRAADLLALRRKLNNTSAALPQWDGRGLSSRADHRRGSEVPVVVSGTDLPGVSRRIRHRFGQRP